MLTPSDVWRLFTVDFQMGKLYWKEPPKNHHARLLGAQAGSPRASHSGKVYWHVKVGGRAYKRSHLIYAAFYGVWPVPCADHINGDSLDDRPCNLRRATHTENAWNHKRRKKRAGTPMGVRELPSGRYQARIGFNGKQLHLGSFSTEDEALAAYRTKREALYGEFA